MVYQGANLPRAKQTASPDKYPQKRFNPKPCKSCGEIFTPNSPCQFYCCQECMDLGYTDRYLQRNYSISLCQLIELYEDQAGRCQICGSRGFVINPNSMIKLVVDHCHSSGNVRGLLCHNCNRALGLMQDDVESLRKAAAYLEGATTIRKE